VITILSILLLLFEPIQVEATAYCGCEVCCGDWADGVTASGHVIQEGDKFIACDKSIPFGTMFIIPGYNDGKPTPNLDRGGAITKGHIDLYFDTHQDALDWGRKTITIWRLK
jgi:3D (Asp-Asp-Asp) domain-containing protein